MVVAVGQEPNDLRDQRDLLIDEIATFTDITVTEPGPNGKVSVAIGNQLLVDGATDTVNALAIGAGGAATVGGIATTVTSGNLRGLIDLRDTVIGGANGYIAQLDTLAASVVTSVNARHAAGFGLDGTTGNAFFAGTTAATIALAARDRRLDRHDRGERHRREPAGRRRQRRRHGAAPVRGPDDRDLDHDARRLLRPDGRARSASTPTRRRASTRSSPASSTPPRRAATG